MASVNALHNKSRNNLHVPCSMFYVPCSIVLRTCTDYKGKKTDPSFFMPKISTAKMCILKKINLLTSIKSGFSLINSISLQT